MSFINDFTLSSIQSVTDHNEQLSVIRISGLSPTPKACSQATSNEIPGADLYMYFYLKYSREERLIRERKL